MLELLSLEFLILSGICSVAFNRLWVGKYGTICAIFAFVIQLFSGQKIIKIDWFNFLDLEFALSFNFGRIETLLCILITFILSCLYYAAPIASFEKDMHRKFGILNIFIFFMCVAILSNNVFQFYIAIEALGIISALLVSLEKDADIEATRVFIFNKFASILFLLGVALLALQTKSFAISEICKKEISMFPAILLLIACCCKGAQGPFSYWLIDAVKANIFASILIHAGTIVTVGIIFITKFYFIFEQFPVLKQIMIAIGTMTSLWMGCCALAHNNVKKIIACLTASSAGMMFIICGLGAYSVAILYLICHAFFKSMLFLAFTYLISAMSGERNINRMGGLSKIAPKVTDIIWVSFFFASGFPLLAGFFPKIALSEILKTVNSEILVIAIIAAGTLTIMAIFRMILKTLYGETKSDEMTFFRAAKSNEYNFAPFWGLTIISLLSSFMLWSIFKCGKLSFGNCGVIYSSTHYLRDLSSVMIESIFAISVMLLFHKKKQNRIIEKIAFLIIKHKIYRICVLAMHRAILECATMLDKWCSQIAYILNIKTFKIIYQTGMSLENANKSYFQNHILWIFCGIALCLGFVIFNGILS